MRLWLSTTCANSHSLATVAGILLIGLGQIGCSNVEDWVRFSRGALQQDSVSPLSRTLSAALDPSINALDSVSAALLNITGLQTGDAITLYTDATCTTAVGSDTQPSSGTIPVTATLTSNATYTFYAVVTDTSQRTTTCLPTGVTYKKVKGYTVSTVLTPNTTDSNTADGICNSGAGACTLRAAIDQAKVDTEEILVKVPAGTYLMSSNISFSMTGLTHPITVRGATGAILDGQNTTWHMTLAGNGASNGFLTIEGLTFQNGNHTGAFGMGGAIEINIFNGTLTNKIVIQDCIIQNNKADDFGGGIYVRGMAIDIKRIKFIANTLDVASGVDGLSIYTTVGQVIQFEDISVTGHTTNPTFATGIVTAEDTRTTTFKNMTISGNTSPQAAMVAFNCDSCSLENTTIANNTGRGFAFSQNQANETFSVINSTFADNRMSTPAGTNRNIDALLANASASFNLRNTILYLTNPAGRSFERSGPGVFTATSSIINDASHGFGAGVTNVDPLLGALASNGGFAQTMLPGATSPAIDTGSLLYCSATDQRGLARPKSAGGVGPFCDIGAVEVQ